MKANCPRILLAGDRSPSGKTTIVAGLLSALCRRGLKVQPFKVAMDYIDPSYHTWITGSSCRNLDGYLMGEDGVGRSFAAHAAGGERALGRVESDANLAFRLTSHRMGARDRNY